MRGEFVQETERGRDNDNRANQAHSQNSQAFSLLKEQSNLQQKLSMAKGQREKKSKKKKN